MLRHPNLCQFAFDVTYESYSTIRTTLNHFQIPIIKRKFCGDVWSSPLIGLEEVICHIMSIEDSTQSNLKTCSDFYRKQIVSHPIGLFDRF